MSKPIRRTVVIGAGVMGSGIAAHFANAGLEVLLLDIVPPNLTDAEKTQPAARNRFAQGGLDKALKSRPAALFEKGAARLIKVGNTEDHLDGVAKADLVIEAVLEKLEVKQALFTRLEKLVQPHTLVASNTSGLRIHDMLQGRGDAFKKNFLVMHFFNPVRYMKLLELVAGPDTSPDTLARVKAFGEDVLGKGIVFGKDTPNFVGNRIGTHAMLTGIHLMLEDKLSPEDVDNITGSPMGHPKSASFRTADLVGLDTFVHVDGREEDPRRQDEGGLLPQGSEQGDRDVRPIQGGVPRERRRRVDQGDHQGALQDRGHQGAHQEARCRPGEGGDLRLEGALAVACLLGAAHR
jgi:3-hydroxyacyl-CoA dehydrogenase